MLLRWEVVRVEPAFDATGRPIAVRAGFDPLYNHHLSYRRALRSAEDNNRRIERNLSSSRYEVRRRP